jgi:AP-3 complex subunit sigma
MIKAILVINNYGLPRLLKFYEIKDTALQQKLLQETFKLVSKRQSYMCNFIEGSTTSWGKDTKLIYRHYATLYFVFVVDDSESELGILDLIQTFVEALDRIFRNVCELDMILHVDRVRLMKSHIFAEISDIGPSF